VRGFIDLINYYMTFNSITPFYVSKWKPFRYSIIFGFGVFLIYLLASASNGTFYYGFSWMIAAGLGVMSLIITYVVLVVTTLFKLWLNPPQNKNSFINDDWWKP